MKLSLKTLDWRLPIAIALALGGGQMAAAAGFVALSGAGQTVLTACNPDNTPGNTTCEVSSLPGESGFELVASRSGPIIVNEVTVGTVFEKVWRHATDTKLHIFGSRVELNTEVWDPSGAAFNVNDLSRRTLPGRAVAVAYFLDGASKALKQAGRTAKGLNEYERAQPRRDNSWVDFRIDANAADPDGLSSAKSPWLLVKTKAPAGIELNSFGLRTLNSDFADPTQAVDVFMPGYQPVGVPDGGDD